MRGVDPASPGGSILAAWQSVSPWHAAAVQREEKEQARKEQERQRLEDERRRMRREAIEDEDRKLGLARGNSQVVFDLGQQGKDADLRRIMVDRTSQVDGILTVLPAATQSKASLIRADASAKEGLDTRQTDNTARLREVEGNIAQRELDQRLRGAGHLIGLAGEQSDLNRRAFIGDQSFLPQVLGHATAENAANRAHELALLNASKPGPIGRVLEAAPSLALMALALR